MIMGKEEMLFQTAWLATVPLDAEFAVEGGLTKVGDFPTHSHPPLPALFHGFQCFQQASMCPWFGTKCDTP